MMYTVTWKRIPGGQVIQTEKYNDRDKAIEAASFDMVGGLAVEIIVTASDGSQIHSRLPANGNLT